MQESFNPVKELIAGRNTKCQELKLEIPTSTNISSQKYDSLKFFKSVRQTLWRLTFSPSSSATELMSSCSCSSCFCRRVLPLWTVCCRSINVSVSCREQREEINHPSSDNLDSHGRAARSFAESLTCCRPLRTSSANAPSWSGTIEEPLCAFVRAACRSTSLLLSLSRKSLVFWMEAPWEET